MSFESISIKALLLILVMGMNINVFGYDDPILSKLDSTVNIHKPWDRFSVSLGGFFASYNSGIAMASEQLGLGLVINLESALDLEVSTWAARGKMNYRFGKTRRHGITFGYFQINRKAFKTLEKELEIGNVIIPLGTDINSKFNFTILRLKYDYSFYQDDRISLGTSFGLFIMPISFSIEVKGSKVTSADVLAPLPVLGFRSDFLITNKFYYRQSVELLYLSFEGFTGSILDFDISLEYRPINHFGIGLGINTTKMELTSKGSTYPNIDFFGKISSSYTGVYIFGKYIL